MVGNRLKREDNWLSQPGRTMKGKIPKFAVAPLIEQGSKSGFKNNFLTVSHKKDLKFYA